MEEVAKIVVDWINAESKLGDPEKQNKISQVWKELFYAYHNGLAQSRLAHLSWFRHIYREKEYKGRRSY